MGRGQRIGAWAGAGPSGPESEDLVLRSESAKCCASGSDARMNGREQRAACEDG